MCQLQALDIHHIQQFLLCETPKAWIEKALQHIDHLLVDHAVCELKAASQAMSLINRYPHLTKLCQALSPLAREELLHFEKVLAILHARNIPFKPQACSNYAKALHQIKASGADERLIDTLIIAAIIEARSCERFYALLPYLDEDLAKFYHSLVRAEARHFELYLDFAYAFGDKNRVKMRIEALLLKEQALIEGEAPVFCFHSGV